MQDRKQHGAQCANSNTQFVKIKIFAQRLSAALTGLALMMMPLAAWAATAKDIQIAARVLNFTSTPYPGTVKLGIVFDPANAASAADAQSLLGILGSGLTVGSVTLVPVPVPIAKIAASPVDVLFLTAGLGAKGALAGAQAIAARQLCITTDTAATAAGYCAVSVESAPSVHITVNKAAAAASKINFASAFLMMVTEI